VKPYNPRQTEPTVLFSQNKPATNNQPTVLFSQNKSAPAISHQPNEQAAIKSYQVDTNDPVSPDKQKQQQPERRTM
jgi:hypothetical protein